MGMLVWAFCWTAGLNIPCSWANLLPPQICSSPVFCILHSDLSATVLLTYQKPRNHPINPLLSSMSFWFSAPFYLQNPSPPFPPWLWLSSLAIWITAKPPNSSACHQSGPLPNYPPSCGQSEFLKCTSKRLISSLETFQGLPTLLQDSIHQSGH